MPSKVEPIARKEKQALEKTLRAEKEKILYKLRQFHSESKEVETDIAQDVVDKAESSYTKEFLLSLSDAERRQLALIDDALRRLPGKEFGLCQMCGKPIGKKRLSALPWSAYCIDCQQKQEQEKA
jgi:RNA polymerase-binding transcription factor